MKDTNGKKDAPSATHLPLSERDTIPSGEQGSVWSFQSARHIDSLMWPGIYAAALHRTKMRARESDTLPRQQQAHPSGVAGDMGGFVEYDPVPRISAEVQIIQETLESERRALREERYHRVSESARADRLAKEVDRLNDLLEQSPTAQERQELLELREKVRTLDARVVSLGNTISAMSATNANIADQQARCESENYRLRQNLVDTRATARQFQDRLAQALEELKEARKDAGNGAPIPVQLYRALAKILHPDTPTPTPEARGDAFKLVTDYQTRARGR